MELHVVTDFPGGNANVQQINYLHEGEEIKFSAECKRGEPQPLWFHFRIEGSKEPLISCILTNASQCLGNTNDWVKNAPVYRTKDGQWQRINNVQIVNDEHLVPQAVFDIYTLEHQIEVAFCYPYQRYHLEKVLQNNHMWKNGLIGNSPGGNQINRLYNNLGDKETSKPGIYLLARQHSGETPGSFVLDGLLRYLSSEKGRKAYDDICWWVVPFIDVDGVLDGSYGKDQFFGDLNRAWNNHLPKRPEIKAVQMDINRWVKKCRPFAVIDLHAPSHQEQGFYFNLPDATPLLLKLSKEFANDFKIATPKSLQGNKSYIESKRGSDTSTQAGINASNFVSNEIGCMAATLEISYQGSRDNEYYSIEDYQTLGRVLAEVLYEYSKKCG